MCSELLERSWSELVVVTGTDRAASDNMLSDVKKASLRSLKCELLPPAVLCRYCRWAAKSFNVGFVTV